ncbi:MAG: DUF1444 family protein [Planctomycetota bacterium]
MKQIALGNIAQRIPQIQVEQNGPFLNISTGDNFEACTLLNGGFWDELSGSVPGEIVVSVPHRDVVIASLSQEPDAVAEILDIAKELLACGDNHALTDQLFTRVNSSWQLYSPE